MRRLTGRLWWLGFLGFLHLADDSLAWTRLLFLFFLAPLLPVVPWIVEKLRNRSERPTPALPLPGPARRGGTPLMMLRFWVSSILTFLSRTGRRQLMKQVKGERKARQRIGAREPGPDPCEPEVGYTLPVAGEWVVVNGGVTKETSHSWDLLSQRFAHDLVIADADGRRHVASGRRPEDYHAYGEPVLAPADGEVVQIEDGVRDAPHVGTGWLDWRSPRIAGNAVTIRHREGEYSFLAHLAPGSIEVRPGQSVRRGQPVGRCGHSGHSSEPHLHFQLQDHPDFFQAVGLPARFSGVLVDGADDPVSTYLRAGMRVRAADMATVDRTRSATC